MLTLTEGEKINAKVSPFNAMIIGYVLDRLVREGHLKVEANEVQ